jgi:hypothetical protein
MICRRNMLFGGVLLAGAAVALTAQVSADRYGPLIRALALSDAQMSQLPQPLPAPVRAAPTAGRVAMYPPHILPVPFPRGGDLIPGSVLDSAQQAELAEIAKVLQRPQTSAGAVALGLMDAREWPWGWACPPLLPIQAYAQAFALSGAQMTQFEQLEQTVRQPIFEQEWAKQNRHRELLDSGASEDSAEVKQLMAEISELSKQSYAIRPPHDAALAVLTDAQRTKLAEFQADLELAREAVDLRLVVAPWAGEGLCH